MKFCPKCNRHEDDLLRCTDRGVFPCPAPVDAKPGEHVQVVCRKEGCDRHFVIAATALVGMKTPAEVRCIGLTPCGAKFVAVPSASKAPK